MRLDKLLTLHQYGSRREIKRLLFSKQVTVNGDIVMQDNLSVDPTIQDIRVNGQKLHHTTDVYYMLNKPKSVVTAVHDNEKMTVIDLIKPQDYRKGLYPVGRLDADTTGLLLITNNGQLGYRLLQPKYHVSKVYDVVVNGDLDDKAVEAFDKGVVFLDGTVCKSATLDIIERSTMQSRARVTISEGKYHQVKKMFLSVGVKVIQLHRVAMGNLWLDGSLAEGEYRKLTYEELIQLIDEV